MKYDYKPLQGICIKCLGCMRLEDENFKGIWRCDYYKEGQNEKSNNDTNEAYMS